MIYSLEIECHKKIEFAVMRSSSGSPSLGRRGEHFQIKNRVGLTEYWINRKQQTLIRSCQNACELTRVELRRLHFLLVLCLNDSFSYTSHSIPLTMLISANYVDFKCKSATFQAHLVRNLHCLQRRRKHKRINVDARKKSSKNLTFDNVS